nr:hypothetical protein GCM10020241_40040 [Streptoalloteichus tenebrarius]
MIIGTRVQCGLSTSVDGVVLREWRDVLDSDRSAEVVGLIDAAVAEDRVSPVSDHVRLRLRPDAPAAPESSRHLLVRDDDGRLAGYAHLEPGAEGSPAVAELVVHPELRRRGFGAELVAGPGRAGPRARRAARLVARRAPRRRAARGASRVPAGQGVVADATGVRRAAAGGVFARGRAPAAVRGGPG